MSEYYKKSMKIQKHLIEVMRSLITYEESKYILIETNLRCGIPTKDVHKIAGPFIDEWAYEKLTDYSLSPASSLTYVESKLSSSLEDIFVQLTVEGQTIDVLIDVKSASLEKGNNAGKGSNITSFRKIRPFYEENDNAYFLVLSIKHDAYIKDEKRLGFEIKDFNIFDLKLVESNELKLNKRMGDQFQISNSMQVTQVDRTTSEFLELIDEKYVQAYSHESFSTLIDKIKQTRQFESKKDDLLVLLEDTSLTKKEIISSLQITDSQFARLMKLAKDEKLIYSPSRGNYSLISE